MRRCVDCLKLFIDWQSECCFVDQPTQVYCEQCQDNYCEVCFAAQHRKGSRKQHKKRTLSKKQELRQKIVQNGKKPDSDKVRGIQKVHQNKK